MLERKLIHVTEKRPRAEWKSMHFAKMNIEYIYIYIFFFFFFFFLGGGGGGYPLSPYSIRLWKHKNAFEYSIILKQSDNIGSWNPSSWKTKPRPPHVIILCFKSLKSHTMAGILQVAFLSCQFLNENYRFYLFVFQLKLLLGVQLTIDHHWFR